MAGLLDNNYRPDPLAQGLLGFGTALMTPRQLGGGMAAGMQAFGQGAQEAQRERARMAQDAQRQKMLEQQMEMQQKQFGMQEKEFGFREQQYTDSRAARDADMKRIVETRQYIAQNKPDLLPMFDMDPKGAMARLFPEPSKPQVVAPGAALVSGDREIYRNPKDPELTAMEKSLKAAGIDPASPQGRSLLQSYAVKTATHAPAATQNVTMMGEREEAKVVGKGMGEKFLEIQNAAMSARGKINNLSRLETLLSGYETGRLTPLGKDIASYAASVGINIDKNLGNKEAAEALSNEMALLMRNPSGGAGMPGAMSDADREFLRNMVPGLSKTTGGNRTMIETQRRLAKREVEVARLASEYRKKNGTLDPAFFDELQKWSDANPLFSDLQRATVIAPDGKSATGTIGKPGATGWKIERVQ
jgi:hypothetical protein